MPDIRSHHRVNDILLGPLERPALRWLAAHMPPWMTPDILTGIGVLGALMIFVGYALTNFHPAFLWLASLGFVVNWFGDSLDGTLARYRHIERPRYGFFIDHTVDAFDEALVFFGIGLSPYARFDITSFTLVGYFLMTILVFARTCVMGEFKISYGKLGPTELRAIAILTNAFLFIFGNPAIMPGATLSLTLFDLVILVIGLILWGIFFFTFLRQARELAQIGE